MRYNRFYYSKDNSLIERVLKKIFLEKDQSNMIFVTYTHIGRSQPELYPPPHLAMSYWPRLLNWILLTLLLSLFEAGRKHLENRTIQQRPHITTMSICKVLLIIFITYFIR